MFSGIIGIYEGFELVNLQVISETGRSFRDVSIMAFSNMET